MGSFNATNEKLCTGSRGLTCSLWLASKSPLHTAEGSASCVDTSDWLWLTDESMLQVKSTCYEAPDTVFLGTTCFGYSEHRVQSNISYFCTVLDLCLIVCVGNYWTPNYLRRYSICVIWWHVRWFFSIKNVIISNKMRTTVTNILHHALRLWTNWQNGLPIYCISEFPHVNCWWFVTSRGDCVKKQKQNKLHDFCSFCCILESSSCKENHVIYLSRTNGNW